MTRDHDDTVIVPAPGHSRALSSSDLAALGIGVVAFVKPVVIDGQKVFVVHAADGQPLAVAPVRELAFSAAREHNLEPMSVH